MDRFRILGPNRLQGCVRASGAKNAALPALAASLLAEETLVLRELPRVADIRTMLRLLAHLGVQGEALAGGGLALACGDAPVNEAPYDLVKTMRASVLVLGPLVARRGSARVSLPGGCAIGVRPIDQHLAGLEALGASVELREGYVHASASRLRGGRFRFSVPTVTGTENLMMAAVLARGDTVLENCAMEPEVVDLGRLLQSMGARIEGLGGNRIVIEGVDRLGGTDHVVVADRIEAGTYLVAGAITGGDVTVQGARGEDLAPLLEKLADSGAEVEMSGAGVRVRSKGELASRDMTTAPHPGFPTDLQAQYVALMTQARGTATVSETVFENRFQHVPELARMGAVIAVDGNRARIEGPTGLTGAQVMATDLRASACLVLAGLVAEGETVIQRIYHLDRGYEHMETKLLRLGGRVERLRG